MLALHNIYTPKELEQCKIQNSSHLSLHASSREAGKALLGVSGSVIDGGLFDSESIIVVLGLTSSS